LRQWRAASRRTFSKEAADFIQEGLNHAGRAFTVISSQHFIPFFNEPWITRETVDK
jgi:hypothetical protein